jgi:hypothetical protein
MPRPNRRRLARPGEIYHVYLNHASNFSLLRSRPSRVVAAAPIKADVSTNQATSASVGATKGARFSGQDDVKQSQKSPVFSRGGGPALVDPSSEKYTLMPESLRRKSLYLLHMCMLHVLIAAISCSRGIGETPNICPSLSSYS